MKPPEIQFNPDERSLLNWLNTRVKADAALTVSDTALIQALQWEDQRFFAAKMRLVAAGVLGMYIDDNGRQILRLLMPERAAKLSRRYILKAVPLECSRKVDEMITIFRMEQ